MAINEMTKLKKLKRQDVQDLRNAGVYDNGREKHEDEHGDLRTDIMVPNWRKHLHKAWSAPVGMREFNDFHKRFVPTKKCQTKPKMKRSQKMLNLLAESGITVDDENQIVAMNGTIYEGWFFTVNGKCKYRDEPTIPTYLFIKEYS